jgi:hypothetical protein
MKNKRWLTSRNTQNTSSKHKNFTIFPLINRDIDAKKTRFQPAKTKKMPNFFQDVEIQNLEVIYEEQVMVPIMNQKNKTSKNKISPFSSYPQRNRC